MAFIALSLVGVLIVLGIMVVVHEFGHFLVAKYFGVKVEVFSIGFGKRVVGFKRGDTDYRISMIPLGGYVKMTGEQPGEETAGAPEEFNSHPRWQRVCIGLAGPVANFVLAFALVGGQSMMHNEEPLYLTQQAIIDYIVPNTPAARSGLLPGDKFVKFDGIVAPTWEQVDLRSAVNLSQSVSFEVERDGQVVSGALDVVDPGKGEDFEVKKLGLIERVQAEPLSVRAIEEDMPARRAGLEAGDEIVAVDGLHLHSVQAVLAYLQIRNGALVTLDIKRGNQSLTIQFPPALAPDETGKMSYRMGFQPVPPPYRVVMLPFIPAMAEGWKFCHDNGGLILEVLRRMLTGKVALQSTLSGPVGIARQTGLALTMPGWQPIIRLMAIISLNLGIFNLLPIPILDGGLIVMLLIESIIRRDLDMALKERVYQVAFVVLILFSAFVIFNDVSKIHIFNHLKP
jgi:regulator of sigma E protease